MQKFADIIGHGFVVESLKKAMNSGRVSHAYIFDGIEGVGRKSVAQVFAKTLQCQNGADEPCNECISCRAFGDLNHPDVIYVTPEKTQSLGVDDIREQVNKNAKIKPYQYKYKIFIIDNADEMTVQAQNALLKTIEEPPSYAVFLLISSSLKNFLPTIISRCVIYKLKPAGNDDVMGFLKAKGYNEMDAIGASAPSGGSIGKALMLIEDESFKEDRAEISSHLNRLPDLNLWDILLLAKELEKYKDNAERMLSVMYLWYRDALIYKSTGSMDSFMQMDMTKNIIAFAKNMSLKKLAAGIDSVIDARWALGYNANYLLTMEVMLMKMAGM